MPAWAAFRSLARPCSLTWSTRCLIEVCALDSGTSAMPTATGFKSMIVQNRKPRGGHREDFRKFLGPMFDPVFPVVHPFPEQEGPPHAARHTVIPACHGRINQMGTRSSWADLLG